MDQIKSEAEALAAILKNNFEPGFKAIGKVAGRDVSVLLAPSGIQAFSIKNLLDEYAPQPDRRRGTATVTDIESFIAIANRFKDDQSALFGLAELTPPKASLTAVFNYNRRGGDVATDQDGAGVARHGDHRAVYDFPFSDQWKAWIKMNGEAMSQTDFAAFIEDRIADVEMPDPALLGSLNAVATGGDFGEKTPTEQLAALAKLLGGEFATPNRLVELSRGLAVREGSKVKGFTNLSSGETQIQYETEHTDDAGQPLKVPNLFLIAIPLFVNSWAYRIAVRLRYRLMNGKVVWFYQLYRHDLTFQKAFEEHCTKAATETELPLYLGKPE
jgi:hypothetical protein